MNPSLFLNIPATDYIIVPAGWILGNIIFNEFEKHLPLYRRFFKFIITVGILYIVDYFLGSVVLYSVLGAMLAGMVVLHLWWFPKNGINGLTAQPYDRYLDLIDRMKSRR